MIIQDKAITDIKPYLRNPRKKNDFKKVADSIKEFGWQQPIVVDRGGVIIVGHSRYEAAKLLKCESIPVLIADLSPEKAKAYRIADNKTNEFSEWDFGLLHKEFAEEFVTFEKEEGVKIKTDKSCPNCGTKLK